MSKLTIDHYGPDLRLSWERVIGSSKNGCFMHLRKYIDYNASKYQEMSAIVFMDGSPYAVFPCNADGADIISYSGLPYAGLIYGTECKTTTILDIFRLLIQYYKDMGFRRLIYKAVPHIYHRYPAEEDLYALFRNKAQLIRRDISSAIPLGEPLIMSSNRKRMVQKAIKNQISCYATSDFKVYWQMLTKILNDRHKTTPTHKVDEIELLASRFPENIRLYCANCSDNDSPLAGIVIYDFSRVIHCQYLACSDEGKSLGALDLLISKLIEGKLYPASMMSLGISTEDEGLVLNEGLMHQKEGFGARAIVHDFYSMEL